MWFSSDLIKNKPEDALNVLLETWPSSSSTAHVTAVGFWGLVSGRVSLTCAFFIADVPASFSPFVEFKEKTQQWKLLGEYLVLYCDSYCSKGSLFSPGLDFPTCCSLERKTSRAVNSFLCGLSICSLVSTFKNGKRYHAALQRSLIHL